ncbi:hypothetical protein BDW22DRAFT_1384197 [Trametopsis cervina]|nr:hypothetical protein BDW22DRAFT_1384197 [Trametopsis cervina]
MRDDHPGVDADQVWVDLCRGDATAMQYCKSFLQVYVLTSVRQRVVLDDREEFEERTIKSSRSLNTFWKSLIAAADAEVLLPMREDPKNHWMTLKRPTNTPGSLDEGPVSQISHWIYEEGAEVMGLSTVSDYTKVEFTVTDIGLILKTLWLCADLVCFRSPIQRVIFHALVLLFSFGYRQGMIIGMKYREVVVALIRDDKGRPRLATTFTINRNKLRANALEHTKGEKFQFTTTLLPYPLLCLTHLVCVVGVHFNAFKAGYTSIDDIFQRPNLEHVNYVHLEWRGDFLDQEIFPMSYSSFTRTLHHVLLVAGFSTVARVYAFRLGALIEYDGSLTQAVRNFVASHTTMVFENNYQTEHVRADLASKRFGAYAGGESSEPLFNVMRDLSKQNDPGAPLEPTPEQKSSIKSRRDITKRRTAYKAAKLNGDPPDVVKAKKASLDQRQRALYDLLLMDAREKYFAEANKLRAEGKSTDALRERSRSARRHCDHAVLDVGGLMTLWTGEAGFGRTSTSEELVFDDKAEDRSGKAMTWLLHYAAQDWTPLTLSTTLPAKSSTPAKKNSKAGRRSKATTNDKLDRWTCLLCDDTSYSARKSLTRHNTDHHIRHGTFDQPFPCPQCTHDGIPLPPTICSAFGWADHVETAHGKRYAPIVTEEHLKAPVRQRKRKREMDETTKPSIPGKFVLDLSEDMPRKKARSVSSDRDTSTSTGCDSDATLVEPAWSASDAGDDVYQGWHPCDGDDADGAGSDLMTGIET